MRSPAVLFYTSDFLTGVSNLTMEERGQYITILCLQHQLGHLSKKAIEINVPSCSVDVIKKLTIDEQGLYYHHRMEEEIQKREHFVGSRYENGYKGGRPKKEDNHMDNHKVSHMGNHIGNDNDNINICTNIIDNNKYIKEDYNDIISYLNLKTNSSYKPTTPKTRELIKARYNEGFNIDDFKQVIDNKVNAWGKDKKMSIYLRPETLFSNKFEGYLNEKTKQTTKNLKIDISDF